MAQPNRSASTAQHRHLARGADPLTCRLVVVSDSRSERTDESGKLAARLVREHGHHCQDPLLVSNDRADIAAALDDFLGGNDDCLVLLGGTGLSSRDGTVEVVEPRLEKTLPGYGEAFRRLSWDEIGTAAILSRALAGSIADRLIAVTPGSPNAVATALGGVLLPELAHLLREVRR